MPASCGNLATTAHHQPSLHPCMLQQGAGLNWLFPFVDGHPPIGWGPAVAYLVMPVLLIISQYVSQKIMSPQQNNDPAAQQSQAILKFLPIMIGGCTTALGVGICGVLAVFGAASWVGVWTAAGCRQ